MLELKNNISLNVFQASFKKPKKKVRKLRKKPKVVTADDLIPLDSQDDVDHGSRGGRR